jgi:hypothetical protein
MNRTIILSFILAGVFAGCKENEVPEAQEPAGPSNIEVKISHQFGDEPFRFEPTTYQLPGGEDLTFTRFSYLMSNFYLLNEAGDTVFIDDQYSVIRVKEGQDTLTLRKVPNGKYVALGFEIGLDDSINFGNPNRWGAYDALNPTNHNLYWGWAGGYIFMAIEGKTTVSGKNQLVVYHLAGDEYRNRVEVKLADGIEYSGGQENWNFSLDLEQVMGDPHPFKMADVGYFSHSGDTALLNLIRNTRLAFSYE